MRKVSTIIGQDLISLADGHRIAPVQDVVLDGSQEHVSALVVQDGGILSNARLVPIGDVRSYGPDAIVIEGDDAVIDAGSEPGIEASGGRSLSGMKVYSTDGQEIGSIADVYFEEADGRVVGFAISSGTVGDLAEGRRFLPSSQLDHVGDDIVYVRQDAAEGLGPVPESTGGAKGALEDAKSKVAEVTASIGSAAQDATGDTQAWSDLVGRRAGDDVTDAEGRIIVAGGQEISADHAERAESAGRTDELRQAADRWSAAERERMITGTVEQIGDAAGGAWDSFMRKISELTDATGKRMSEEETKARLAAINDAVGRPVTKVILDRSDDVILNLGDIITHEAVQRAYDAGILDTLLASVYKGEVAFERDEMKAATEGTSTVERASGGAAVVADLETSVETAESERQTASEAKRHDAEAARERRDSERQERAQARDEAAARAAAGEPSPSGADELDEVDVGDVENDPSAQASRRA